MKFPVFAAFLGDKALMLPLDLPQKPCNNYSVLPDESGGV